MCKIRWKFTPTINTRKGVSKTWLVTKVERVTFDFIRDFSVKSHLIRSFWYEPNYIIVVKGSATLTCTYEIF